MIPKIAYAIVIMSPHIAAVKRNINDMQRRYAPKYSITRPASGQLSYKMLLYISSPLGSFAPDLAQLILIFVFLFNKCRRSSLITPLGPSVPAA